MGRRTTRLPRSACVRAVLVLLPALGWLAAPRPACALLPLANASGEALYQRECAPCHGPTGHGDGPEAPTFRSTPRDFGDLARVEPSPRIVERVRRSRLRMLELDEEVVVERRKRMVEELVGYLQRMPDLPWPQVHRGADVYAERCEKCHGPNGRPVTVDAAQRGASPTGRQPAPDFQKTRGDAELLAIAQGRGHAAMPGFAPVVSEEDARALLAYLRNLSNGFVWYSLWCVGCHGDEGRGDGLLATGIDKPPVVFDRAYLGAQTPAELRRKAMHVFSDIEPASPHFVRNLSEGQTRAVLSAVRVLQASATTATQMSTPSVRPTIGAPVATGAGTPRAPVPVGGASPATPMPASGASPAQPAVASATPAATATVAAPRPTSVRARTAVKPKPKPKPTPRRTAKPRAKTTPAKNKLTKVPRAKPSAAAP